MIVKFYGTRGSVPVCDANFQKFGGNTTCISIYIKETDNIFIIDAGTGIRNLGQDMMADKNRQKIIGIGFTHFHWDHIQGFPFFLPAYRKDTIVNINSVGDTSEKELKSILQGQMQSEYFPIPMSKMGSKFKFTNLGTEYINVNGIRVKMIKQNHPGTSYGVRIEINGSSLVICTDVEHEKKISEDFIDFCKDADLLIHDAQYTDNELEKHRGWGHSSYNQALEVAERSNAKMLVMTHHDPDHDDDFLKKQEKICQERFKSCELAREGTKYDLDDL
ncbi:MAG: MBL fold metallo-hydrolase [Cyclobacteriaceae bacterium]|jgi:phosphoribosyl 1,2-cyclic phosphodiesterase